MNAGYISAFAALAGSLIGGLTTFAAAWVTQRQQANGQWLLQEKTRRQELYQQFIEEASKLYVDALIHDQAEIPPLVSLYASINKMRVVSNPGIAERADKVVRIIVDTYVLPNKSFQEVRAMMVWKYVQCAWCERLPPVCSDGAVAGAREQSPVRLFAGPYSDR